MMSSYEAATMDSKNEKLPFTLTLLGTSTDFTPQLKQAAKTTPYTKGAKVKDYPKGETLSVVASLIKTTATPKPVDAKNPYPFQSDEVTVINGPKTDGSNVGEKIAQGLAALLKAIARGQKRINIMAHSRGAVEAILITHELEAIQTIIANCSSFEEVLKHLLEQQTKRHKGTPTNNTPDIIVPLRAQMNLIPKEEQEQWFNRLKLNISGISVNFFGIDPVPGDCFPITWYDERFFVLPGIVKNTELIYYANERSDWGFTPIYPEVVTKERQNLICYSMPGHHGTGSSGNNASQLGIVVSPEGYKTTHVQKLMVVKLLNFLNQQGVEFFDGVQLFRQHSALGRKYLGIPSDAVSIDCTLLDYPSIFRALYAAIARNQVAYEAYNLTNYSYMGLVKQRRLLHKKHIYGLFNERFTTYLGYVNEEHAALVQAYFFRIFGLDTKKNPTEMLNTASLALEENIKKIASKDTSILDTEMTRRNVLETFGIVIQRVCQHYLTDDWSLIEKEKDRLYCAIIDLLIKFKELAASDDEVTQQFVTKLISLSYISINNTLVRQYQCLEKEFNCLHESLDNRLTQFFSSLLMQLNHSENPAVPLNELMSAVEYKALPNYPADIKITYLYQKLVSKGLEKYTIEQLAQNFEEQFPDSITDYAKLYQQTQLFIKDLAAFCQIVPRENIEVEEQGLLRLMNELIATAAKRFYKERAAKQSPLAEKDPFVSLAEQYAIKHLGVVAASNGQDETNTLFSKALSFFWSPMSRMIYGAPATKEDAEKSSTCTPP